MVGGGGDARLAAEGEEVPPPAYVQVVYSPCLWSPVRPEPESQGMRDGRRSPVLAGGHHLFHPLLRRRAGAGVFPP